MVTQLRTSLMSRRLMLSIALLVLGMALAGFFGVGAYRAYRRFSLQTPTPSMTDIEAIRGWMTVPYIARAYGVPEDALFAALSIPKAENEQLSVKQLVAKYGRDPLATRQTIQQVLLREPRRPTPSGGAP